MPKTKNSKNTVAEKMKRAVIIDKQEKSNVVKKPVGRPKTRKTNTKCFAGDSNNPFLDQTSRILEKPVKLPGVLTEKPGTKQIYYTVNVPKQVKQIHQYFVWGDRVLKDQAIGKPVAELACTMLDLLPEGAERQAGLRKLLEALDCFLRANNQEVL